MTFYHAARVQALLASGGLLGGAELQNSSKLCHNSCVQNIRPKSGQDALQTSVGEAWVPKNEAKPLKIRVKIDEKGGG